MKGLLLTMALAGSVFAAPPTILIIVAVDLGYGDLGCTGNPRIRTANIDRLAKEATTLANFYAAGSVCSPSRAAMMTARIPYRHGIHGLLQFVDFYEPHWFVDAPREIVGRDLGSATDNENEANYFAAVEQVDRQVGRILKSLDDERLANNTLLFITSDNGPANLRKTETYSAGSSLVTS